MPSTDTSSHRATGRGTGTPAAAVAAATSLPPPTSHRTASAAAAEHARYSAEMTAYSRSTAWADARMWPAGFLRSTMRRRRRLRPLLPLTPGSSKVMLPLPLPLLMPMLPSRRW